MHEPAGVVEILVQILTEYPLFWSSEYPPKKWKLLESPNLRVSEYPPKWKLSESPNPRASEYPPNENCQRVQIWELQNTPQMKIVTESKSESFRIPPPMKIVTESKSENFRIPPPPHKNQKNFRFQTLD